ncbi:hypothetical protein [Gracilibacillus saliphilus]|uniref:hypothetical protein n=1 Tax=Gracilibacillus saliphilus TaxID=543890 RepID=UPI001EE1916F|nr:hypothetical protein [Gracilibacillus saliphilus]
MKKILKQFEDTLEDIQNLKDIQESQLKEPISQLEKLKGTYIIGISTILFTICNK